MAKRVAGAWAEKNYATVINMSASGAVDFVSDMFGVKPLFPSSGVPILAAHQAERAASNNSKNTVAALLTLVMLSGEMNVC